MIDVTLGLLLAVVGTVLLAEALLARYELLAYTAGWERQTGTMPEGVPYARGADPLRPPSAYLVYLDGIGKRRFTDSRDGGQLVRALLQRAPGLRILGQVQPYSPAAVPLADRHGLLLSRRRSTPMVLLHNAMQILVAADRRYRPLYNRAVGTQIATQLQRAGYRPGSGIPVLLLGYSGGAQTATGAVAELHRRLDAPVVVLTLGGFHNGANDLSGMRSLHRFTSDEDRIERLGTWIFPQRWPRPRTSAWNQAIRAGKVTVHHLDPATHLGEHNYIHPHTTAPDGHTYLSRTVDALLTVIEKETTG